MATNIGPKIGIDGEAEFRKQLNLINTQLTTLGTEMKKVTSEFGENSNSQDALIAKNKVLNASIEKQEEQLEAVSEALKTAKEKFGDNSTEVQKWQQVVNRSETQLNQFKSELSKNEQQLSEMETGLRDAKTGLSKMGDEASKTSGDLKKASGGLDDLKEALSEAKGALAGGAVVVGLKEIGDAISSVVEETREYRRIMASLESSSEAAGYSAEQTSESFTQLYGILGDEQTAATTTANLQAIGLEQSKLTDVTYAAIGAWARYGDSIPIDGLAESINETIKAGQVTGTFADVLNWAGTNEDSFNEKLAAARTESERTNIVLEELASQGLTNAGKAWEDNNKNLVEGQKATARYKDALAEIGETLEPVKTTVTNMFSTLLEEVGDFFDFLIENKEIVTPIITGIGVALLTWGVATMIQGLVSVLGTLKTAILGINTAMLANPFVLVASLIAGLVTALITLWNTSEGFRNSVLAVWETIKNGIGTAVDAITGFFESLWNDTVDRWNETKEAVLAIWEAIKVFFTGILETIINIFTSIKTFISNTITNIKDTVIQVFSNIVGGVKEKVVDIKNTIVTGFNEAIDFIKSLPKKAIGWGKDFVQGLIDGIKSKFGGIVDSVKGIGGKIKEFLHFSRPDKGPLREYEKWMPDFMKGLAKGIRNNEPMVISAAASLADNMAKALNMSNNVAYTTVNDSIINLNSNIVLDGKIVGRVAEKYISSNQKSVQRMKGVII